MRQWTRQQREAIESRERDILVSAAAGSGKTAVLVERILSFLREGACLERMLVVTFTRAAAAEMRQRLSQALARESGEDRHLRAQYLLVGRADICTLHTYCTRILRRCFQAADTDPLSRVGDEPLLRALFDRALQEEMEELYLQEDDDARALARQYKSTQIEEMLRQLYGFLMSQDEPWGWLEGSLNLPGDAGELLFHPWYETLLKEALLTLEGAGELAEECLRIAAQPGGPARYEAAARADRALIDNLIKTLAQNLKPGEEAPSFTALSRKKAPPEEEVSLAERFKKCRGLLKDLVTQALALLPAGEAGVRRALQSLGYTLPAMRGLAELARRFHGRYAGLKEARLLWDYHDLEHLALRALRDPQAARAVSGELDAVFVDEYQDISRIQEAILEKLREQSSLFLVGDARQSIYRFRLADPGLFLGKQERLDRKEGPGLLVRLSHNFRSQANLLKGVNLVFGHAMRSRVTEMDYKEEDRLRPGLPELQGPPLELHLIRRDDPVPEEDPAWEEDGEPEEGRYEDLTRTEAALIARRMTALFMTPSLEDGRPLRWRDMVVLLRSASGRAHKVADTLREAGIPVYSEADAQFFDLPEVTDVLNILRVLDNPCQDAPLLGALSCPAFGFSPEDLARIRLDCHDPDLPFHRAFLSLKDRDLRVGEALRRIGEWRFRAAHMKLETFLRRLLRETGLYARAGALSGGELRRANLRLLCQRAAPDPYPQTLKSFLDSVDQARRQEDRQSAAALSEHEDVVRILTLHKSKGLEFPVVFLPDLDSRFKLSDSAPLLLCDARDGMALRLQDPDRRLCHPTLAGTALARRKDRELRSEEARLLYVGMTRARERLVLIGTPRNPAASERRWSLPPSDYAAGSAGSMLDWLGACLWEGIRQGTGSYTAPNGSRWEIASVPSARLQRDRAPAPAAAVSMSGRPPSPEMERLMRPPREGEALPQKTSVTALVSGALALEEEEGEETPKTKRRPFQKEWGPPPLPAMGGEGRQSGVQRGAATHRALGALDLSALLDGGPGGLLPGVYKGLEALTRDGILSLPEARAADAPGIAAFLNSPLGRRLLAARERHREWPFTLVTRTGMLLQGVIDCCFKEDGGWVLIDYKTDRASPEEILGRYRDQLRWYMRALREITGLPVREAWLVALHAGDAVLVTEEEGIRLRAEARDADSPLREVPEGQSRS